MKASFEYHVVGDDGIGEVMPPEGEVRLVMAWTTPLPHPRAMNFWAFASFKDGKWTENNADKTDLTECVEFWCEMPSVRDLR